MKEIATYFNISETIVKNVVRKLKWKVLDFEQITDAEKIIVNKIKNKFSKEFYRQHLFKAIILIDKISQEELYFESIDNCARHFNKYESSIRSSLKRPKSFINKKYNIKWIKK